MTPWRLYALKRNKTHLVTVNYVRAIVMLINFETNHEPENVQELLDAWQWIMSERQFNAYNRDRPGHHMISLIQALLVVSSRVGSPPWDGMA